MAHIAGIDDTNGYIIYEPEAAWNARNTNTPFNLRAARNGTVHEAIQEGSKATLRFTGTYIELGILLWPSGCNVSIALDGEILGGYNTGIRSVKEAASYSLFNRVGLNATMEHTIVVSKEPNHPDWYNPLDRNATSHLLLDFFSTDGEALSASDGGSSSTGSGPITTSISADPTSPTSQLLPALAIVISLLGGIALAIIAVVFYRRRRRRSGIESKKVLAHDRTAKEDTSAGQVRTVAAHTDPVTPFLPTNDMKSSSPNIPGQGEKRRLHTTSFWEPRSIPRRSLSASMPLDQTTNSITSVSGLETPMTASGDPSQSDVSWVAPWPVSDIPSSPTVSSTTLLSAEGRLNGDFSSAGHSYVLNPFDSAEERRERREGGPMPAEGRNENARFRRSNNSNSSSVIGTTDESAGTTARSPTASSSQDSQNNGRVQQEIDVLMERVRHLRQLAGETGESPDYMDAPPEYADRGVAEG